MTSDSRYALSDQDLLNYCFSAEYLKLPSKFNCWVFRELKSGNLAIERKVYHYIGQNWSFGFDVGNAFHRQYWEYFAKTPWFNAETILNLGVSIKKMHVERQDFAVRVSALLSGKTRAFFAEPANIPALKQFFAVNDAEEIIALSSEESLRQLAKAMNESRGQKVFFLLTFNPAVYNQLKEILTQIGFAEWRDFVNAAEFLSEAHGLPLNEWSIIEKM